MKAIKIIVGIIVFLAVVVGGVIFYGLSNLDAFVEEVIETTGSEITQTSVGVGSVAIKSTMLEGKGAIYNLSVANPKGYSANDLFLAKSISLALDIPSLTQPVKVIDAVNVGEIALRAEQKNIKDTNIQALLDNISSTNTSSSTAKESSSGSDVRIMIKKITFAKTTIDLQTEKLGGRSITLPSFTLTNIGNKKTGVTPEEAGKQIAQQLMNKVKAAVKKELGRLLEDGAKEKLKEKLQDKLKENISTDKLKSLFK